MEIEFKFQIPTARLPALEADMVAGGATRTRLQARYFDTANGMLAKHGIVLRLRREGDRWVQTAKATSAEKGLLHRLEHNFELPEDQDEATMQPDIRRHTGTSVGKRIDKLIKQHDAPLVETFATDISRLACIEQLGNTKVELALDVGKVMCQAADGNPNQYRESLVCELELELVEGDLADLVALADRWSQRHGLWLSTLSKAERGERLMSGVAVKAVKAVKAFPPDFAGVKDSALTMALVQRRVLMACLAQVLPNASEVASGNEDPEVVHQLRVGLRRLRTALRELGGLAAQPSKSADGKYQALTEAFMVLGANRDQHLMVDDLQPKLLQAGAPAMDLVQQAAVLPGVGAAICAAAFQATLVSLVGLSSCADGLSSDPASQHESPLPVLRKRLEKLFRHIVQDGKRFDTLTLEAQHRVRKRLKRLRYLSEFTGALFAEKAAARFVGRLTPALDALGALNDAAVALETYRKAAASDPRAWFAVGWLSAGQASKVKACSAALTQLGEASPFWKKH